MTGCNKLARVTLDIPRSQDRYCSMAVETRHSAFHLTLCYASHQPWPTSKRVMKKWWRIRRLKILLRASAQIRPNTGRTSTPRMPGDSSPVSRKITTVLVCAMSLCSTWPRKFPSVVLRKSASEKSSTMYTFKQRAFCKVLDTSFCSRLFSRSACAVVCLPHRGKTIVHLKPLRWVQVNSIVPRLMRTYMVQNTTTTHGILSHKTTILPAEMLFPLTTLAQISKASAHTPQTQSNRVPVKSHVPQLPWMYLTIIE